MDAYKPLTKFFHNAVPLQDILRSHERWIKEREGQKADLIGADLFRIDLSGAYLRGADLLRANLSGANLHEAFMREAKLPHANLSGADLAGVRLERAHLQSASLRDADLSYAVLVGSDLAGADLSGVRLCETDLSGCVLAGITCTHVLEGEAGEMIRLSPGEFESRYAKAREIAEMIVEIPLSGSAYYIARFITCSVNGLMGSPVIDFRGAERLSESHTRLLFGLPGGGALEKLRQSFEGELPQALNAYFAENQVGSQPSYMGGLLEEAIRGETTVLGRPEIQPEGLMEHYSRLRRIGEDIYGIAHSVFSEAR